jgi:hypothetical protein
VPVPDADFSSPPLAAKSAPSKECPVLDDPVAKTLSPASTSFINSQSTSGVAPKQVPTRTATIRSIPSFQAPESSPESNHSGLSSSVRSNTTGPSTMAGSHLERSPPSARYRDESQNDPPSKWSNHTGGVRVVEPSVQDSSMMSDGADSAENHWDSTVGKAGLGKTGRVINKLVSDNDALKRDLQIERLRADESKQAAKLVEDKMERMINEYESKLLEANVTKTLLSRKERQVENLTATVDLEKKKAQAALEREKSWRDELEKTRKDSTIQVEEATTLAQLMEGRYNAISSHWKDQGMEVDKAVAEMRKDIQAIVAERKDDDNKIQTLRDLCDQQDINIKELLREKEEIARKFEEYKQAQEDDLRAIKTNARGRQEEQEKLLQESRDALDKLRWALNVKKNVEGAQ